MRKHLRFFWPAFAALSLLTAVYNHYTYRALIERNELLETLSADQQQLILAYESGGEACHTTLVDLLQRLGLDDEMMPLIPTIYYKRLTKMSVSGARKKLGAAPYAKGFFGDQPAIGGP